MKAGNKELFSCSNLTLEGGLVALVGRNGSGKSTFLNAIGSTIVPHQGSIYLNGNPVSEFTAQEFAKQLAVVKSRPITYGNYTVYDLLMIGRLPFQGMLAIPSQEDKDMVQTIAERLGISSMLNSQYETLSDGEKQLVMIGRAFVQDTPVILLDEPAAFLDLVNRRELLSTLKKMVAQSGKLIIFSTHHVEVLADFCDGLLLIHDLQLKHISQPSEFNTAINEAFDLNS